MIDGLTLTFSGEEVRTLLEQQMRNQEKRAEGWTRETLRTKKDQTEDAPLLPDHMCENEAERCTWRVSVLAFIRDHIEPAETYRLGTAHLEEIELLPEKPGWLDQEEYEERTRVGFSLERLTKSVRSFAGMAEFHTRDGSPTRHELGGVEEIVIEETDDHRTTRVEVEDGPEIVKIEVK